MTITLSVLQLAVIAAAVVLARLVWALLDSVRMWLWFHVDNWRSKASRRLRLGWIQVAHDAYVPDHGDVKAAAAAYAEAAEPTTEDADAEDEPTIHYAPPQYGGKCGCGLVTGAGVRSVDTPDPVWPKISGCGPCEQLAAMHKRDAEAARAAAPVAAPVMAAVPAKRRNRKPAKGPAAPEAPAAPTSPAPAPAAPAGGASGKGKRCRDPEHSSWTPDGKPIACKSCGQLPKRNRHKAPAEPLNSLGKVDPPSMDLPLAKPTEQAAPPAHVRAALISRRDEFCAGQEACNRCPLGNHDGQCVAEVQPETDDGNIAFAAKLAEVEAAERGEPEKCYLPDDAFETACGRKRENVRQVERTAEPDEVSCAECMEKLTTPRAA